MQDLVLFFLIHFVIIVLYMSKLVVLSGVPGSGKSYFSKALRKKKTGHVYIISSDALRDLVTGNQQNLSEDTLMWKMFGKSCKRSQISNFS